MSLVKKEVNNIKNFFLFMIKLPDPLGVEIFKYLVDELDEGFFFSSLNLHNNNIDTNYNRMYEMAFTIKTTSFLSYNNCILARIKKNNGQHRYYLSKEKRKTTCNDCCRENKSAFWQCRNRNCGGGYSYEIYYRSKYVGKSLNNAIFQLYFSENNF
jgi:hypothetical protein